jgi:hypothetical protein
MFYTYLWLREDGTPYYVGKGKGQRAYIRHRVGNPPPIERIIVQEHQTESEAFEAEAFLIQYYGREDQGCGGLLNLSDGGEGAGNFSKSTLQKMRIARLGKKPVNPIPKGARISPDTEIKKGQRLSPFTEFKKGNPPWNKGKPYDNGQRGRKLSPEAIEKMRQAKLGKKQSPEHIAKRMRWRHDYRLLDYRRNHAG